MKCKQKELKNLTISSRFSSTRTKFSPWFILNQICSKVCLPNATRNFRNIWGMSQQLTLFYPTTRLSWKLIALSLAIISVLICVCISHSLTLSF